MLGAKKPTNMDDCGKAKSRGGQYCIAGAPHGQSCKNRCKKGTRMHQFPSDQTLRAKWVKFVGRHRPDFKDPISKYGSLCEAHFEDSCYSTSITAWSSIALSKTGERSPGMSYLKRTAVLTALLYMFLNTCTKVQNLGTFNFYCNIQKRFFIN